MGKLILIWIELPFIIKAFLFIIILYLYLMLCMQLYTRTETIANRIRKWRYKRITDQYLELIEQSLEQIESGVMIGKSDLVSTEPQDPELVNFEGFKKSYKITNIPNEINDDSLYVYILNSYEGDKEELINYQIKALKGVKINQCILAVKYFETNKYEKVREFILDKLKESIGIYSTDKPNIRTLDLIMASIRYFQVVNSEEADRYILQLVDCPIWEVRVVVLNYLIKLDKSEVEEMYLEKIKDPNWYIRHNSEKALVKIGTSTEKLNRILDGNDQYAKEALEYAMEKRVGRYELG